LPCSTKKGYLGGEGGEKRKNAHVVEVKERRGQGFVDGGKFTKDAVDSQKERPEKGGRSDNVANLLHREKKNVLYEQKRSPIP